MKIKTNYVPDNAKTYLTVGKEYEVDEFGFYTDDVGDRLVCMVKGCAHLDDRDWEVCDASE